jgi:hypothetical protein
LVTGTAACLRNDMKKTTEAGLGDMQLTSGTERREQQRRGWYTGTSACLRNEMKRNRGRAGLQEPLKRNRKINPTGLGDGNISDLRNMERSTAREDQQRIIAAELGEIYHSSLTQNATAGPGDGDLGNKNSGL